MKSTVKIFVYSCIAAIISFGYFAQTIRVNQVELDTDEMYWIHTATIIPKLISRNFADPFWNEYYGFVNFNTAKLVYGIGLPLLGHTDFGFTGIPPNTYYRWVSYDRNPFPQTHPYFTTVRDARYISAFFTSLSVGVMVFIVFILSASPVLAASSGILLTLHPITQTIATHALADGIFLFFELITLLILITMLFRLHKNQTPGSYLAIGLGISMALLSGTKLNGVIFLPFCAVVILRSYQKRILASPDQETHFNFIYLSQMALVFFGFAVTFLCIHPNFFFYPSVSPIQMIHNRLLITRQHIAYYLKHDSEHVLLTFPGKLSSSLRNLFPAWLIIAGSNLVIFRLLFLKKAAAHMKIALSSTFEFGLFFIWSCVLLYVVFDEQRYFLSILPFLIVLITRPDAEHNGSK